MPILVLIKDPTCSACTIRGRLKIKSGLFTSSMSHISKFKVKFLPNYAQNIHTAGDHSINIVILSITLRTLVNGASEYDLWWKLHHNNLHY